jgi:hypothetical protein
MAKIVSVRSRSRLQGPLWSCRYGTTMKEGTRHEPLRELGPLANCDLARRFLF